MYKELSVPENELKDVITELLEYCDEKEEEGELGKTKFSNPVSEEEIDMAFCGRASATTKQMSAANRSAGIICLNFTRRLGTAFFASASAGNLIVLLRRC